MTPEEAAELTIRGIDYWATRWKEQKTGWHLTKVNPILIQFMNRLVPEATESKKFFLPLCGMTYDIGYLLGLGHKVFAIEGVKEVIHDLNIRDNLGLEFNSQDSTYTSPDGKAIIYIGDILECPIEKWGPVDIIWDRASLIAMNYVLRQAYVDVIKRSVQTCSNKYADFQLLLETVRFDKSLHTGPPRPVEEADMKELFADWSEMKIVETLPLEVNFPKLRESLPADQEASIIFYLLTPLSPKKL